MKIQHDAEKTNGKLTEEQQARRKQLLLAVAGISKSIDQQIADLKALQPANQEQANAIQVQIELLERRKQLLEGQTPEAKVENKPLTDKGDEIQQLLDKIKAARTVIEKPFDEGKLKEASTTQIENIKRAFELGAITKEQALTDLQQIAAARGQDAAIQKQAAESITALDKTELSRRVENNKAAQSEIEAQISTGVLDEVQGAQQITRLKKEQLDIQLDNLKTARDEEDKRRAESLKRDLGLQDDIIKENQPKADAGDKDAQATVDAANKKKLELQSVFQSASEESERQYENKLRENRAAQRKNDFEGFKRETEARSKIVLDANKTQVEETEAAVSSGRKDEIAGAESLTRLKDEQLEIQLDTLRKVKEEEDKLRAESLKADLTAIDLKIEALRTKAAGGDTKAAKELEGLNAQKLGVQKAYEDASKASDEKFNSATRQNQAQREKNQLDGLRKVQDIRIKLIERDEKKATDAIEQAEVDRKILIDQNFKSGNETREQIRQSERAAQESNIKRELAAERKRLADLEKLPKFGNADDIEKREALIRGARRKTAELTLKLLEEQTKLQQQAIDDSFAKLKNTLTAQKGELEKQFGTLDNITKSLDVQKTLTEARLNLLKSLSEYTQGEYDLAQKLLQVEDDRQARAFERRGLVENIFKVSTDQEAFEAKRNLERFDREAQIRVLQLEASRAKLESLEAEQELELQNLAIEQQKTLAAQQQEKARLRIAAIDAEIAEAQARANVAKLAIDKTATPEAVEAANLELKLQRDKRAAIGEQQELQRQTQQQQAIQFSIERQQLQKRQGLARDQAEADIVEKTPGGAVAARTRSGESIQKARQSRQQERAEESVLPGSSSATIQAGQKVAQQFTEELQRRSGQPVAAQALGQQDAGLLQQQKQADLLQQIHEVLKGGLSQDSAKALLGQKTLPPVTFNNYFHGDVDRKELQNSQQETLGTLKRVLNLAGAV